MALAPFTPEAASWTLSLDGLGVGELDADELAREAASLHGVDQTVLGRGPCGHLLRRSEGGEELDG